MRYDFNTQLRNVCEFQRFVCENKNNDEAIYQRLELLFQGHESNYLYQIKDIYDYDIAEWYKELHPDLQDWFNYKTNEFVFV